MKRTICLFILLACLFCATPAAYGADEAASDTVTIAVATDTHYLSPRLVDGGELLYEVAIYGDGKMSHYTQEITDAFFAQVAEEKPDFLILSGDLTLNGAKASHEDFAQKLSALQESGVKVLVIPGNHDMDKEYAINYRDSGAEKAEALTFEEFMTLYRPFGMDGALSEDSVTFSYSVQACKGLRIIMLDTNSYGVGTVKEPTFLWLEQELKNARDAGDKVITVSHQNLYAHNRLLSFGYKLYNAAELQKLLEEYGVLCHLSGHIHSQSIVEAQVPEIVTSSLSVSPAQYGVFEYGNGQLSYNTVETDVSSWAKAQGLSDPALLDFAAYAGKFFADNCRRQVGEMYENSEQTEEEISILAETFATLNQDYFAGALPDYAALEPGLELWRAQEKNFTQMYIDTMCQIQKDNRSFSIAVDVG